MSESNADPFAEWTRRAADLIALAMRPAGAGDPASGDDARARPQADPFAGGATAASWAALLEASARLATARGTGWPAAAATPPPAIAAGLLPVHAAAIAAATAALVESGDPRRSLVGSAVDAYLRAFARGYRNLAAEPGFVAALARALGLDSQPARAQTRRRATSRPAAERSPRLDPALGSRIGEELGELREALAAAARALADLAPITATAHARETIGEYRPATVARVIGPASPDARRVPLLLVPPTTAGTALADLHPLAPVGALLERGLDVMVLDWNAATGRPAPDGLDGCLARLDRLVAEVAAATHRRRIDLVGFGLGGTLAIAHAVRRPATVRRLVALAAPVHFHTRRDVHSAWMRAFDFGAHPHAELPGGLWSALGLALAPLAFERTRYRDLRRWLLDPSRIALTLAVQRAVHRVPPQSRRLWSELGERFFRANALLDPARGAALRAPALAVHARGDHLVPAAAARALVDRAPRCRELAVGGGHLDLVAGDGGRVAAEIDAFLRERR